MSPLGVVPKKQPNEYRIIHHLSFPEGTSINDGIDSAYMTVSYASIATALELVKDVGKGAHMAKTDITKAFRIIPIAPHQHHLFCFTWKGLVYYDMCLQMGCSAACQLFERFSSALQWIAQNKIGIPHITHILDDFFFVNLSEEASLQDLDNFLSLCHLTGVPSAPEKTVQPNTTGSSMGIEIDSEEEQVRLPFDKLEKCRSQIKAQLASRSVTLRDLQSVIGLLNFACEVVIPGRAFLRRLIDKTMGVRKPHHYIRVSLEMKHDLKVLLTFLEHYNGKSFFNTEMFCSPATQHLFTDAAGSFGYGAIFGSHWFYGSFSDQWLGQNITLLELAPILLAVQTWATDMHNHCVVFHTDNMALVSVLHRMSSREPLVMGLVRLLVHTCLSYNILFKTVHIEGYHNDIADSLSGF